MADANGLFNKKPSQTYKDLLHTSLTSVGLGSTLGYISDGAGNQLPIKASKTAMTLSCGAAEIDVVSVSSSSLTNCIFNHPALSYVSHASLPLIDSSLGVADLYFPGTNGSSENCDKQSVASASITYESIQSSNLILNNFSQGLESFTLNSELEKDEALFFTVFIDKAAFNMSQNTFGNGQLMLFPKGEYPSNKNFGSAGGFVILKMFYISLASGQGTSSSPVRGNYFCGIVEGNCMVAHFGR